MVLFLLEKNITNIKRKQNMQSSLPSSMNDEITSPQLFPEGWIILSALLRDPVARARLGPVNFLAVCSFGKPVVIRWKLNLNCLADVLVGHLLDNKK